MWRKEREERKELGFYCNNDFLWGQSREKKEKREVQPACTYCARTRGHIRCYMFVFVFLFSMSDLLINFIFYIFIYFISIIFFLIVTSKTIKNSLLLRML